MAKFNELPKQVQILTVLGLVVGLTVAAYFFMYKGMDDENKSVAQEVKKLQDQNDLLRTFEPKLADMNRQIASLREQLETMKKIVPDEKQADTFIHMMQDTAVASGISIRRYSAKQLNNKEFYTEAPYEMELDGPYYNMLGFFDRVGKLERIINVSNLRVAQVTRGGDAGVKKSYAYPPNATVVATCTTTSFFSKENLAKPTAAPAAAPAKK